MMNLISAIELLLIVICGGIFIIAYEEIEAWERYRVFFVGLGVFIGAIGLLWTH